MQTKEHPDRVLERQLTELASALGPHLTDSTIARSVLDEAVRRIDVGPSLLTAAIAALEAARIRIVEDQINSSEYAADEPVLQVAQVLDTASPPRADDIPQLLDAARHRLSLDRQLRDTRLPKVLLTAEQEVGLTLLARPDGTMLEPGGYADLEGESRAAADALFVHNLGLAHAMAKGYQGQGLEYDDLAQSAMLGLIRAVERFDPFAGFKFSTYATWWLRQSLSRAIANEGRLIRIPVHMWEVVRRVMATRQRLMDAGLPATVWHLAKACDLATDKILECLKLAPGVMSLETPLGEDQFTLGDLIDAHADRPEEVEVRGLFPEDVDRLLLDLEAREEDVLRMRFGLAPYDATHTLDQIGLIYGVTRERIRQIESKAMIRLRAHLTTEGHVIEVPDRAKIATTSQFDVSA